MTTPDFPNVRELLGDELADKALKLVLFPNEDDEQGCLLAAVATVTDEFMDTMSNSLMDAAEYYCNSVAAEYDSVGVTPVDTLSIVCAVLKEEAFVGELNPIQLGILWVAESALSGGDDHAQA